MIRMRHVIAIFVPAIIVVFLLFSRVAQQSPFSEKREKTRPNTYLDSIEKPVLRPEDGVIGPRTANHTIIAYMDVSCDHCAEEFSTIMSVIDTYPNAVRFIVKPLATSARGTLAHEYLFCAKEQDMFTEMIETLFTNRTNLDPSSLAGYSGIIGLSRPLLEACLSSPRPSTYAALIADEARALGLTGVPTTYLDGLLIAPPSSAAGWQTLLEPI